MKRMRREQAMGSRHWSCRLSVVFWVACAALLVGAYAASAAGGLLPEVEVAGKVAEKLGQQDVTTLALIVALLAISTLVWFVRRIFRMQEDSFKIQAEYIGAIDNLRRALERRPCFRDHPFGSQPDDAR